MIRRPPRSTQGVSSAASDVYKRQTWEHVHRHFTVAALFVAQNAADPSGGPKIDSHVDFDATGAWRHHVSMRPSSRSQSAATTALTAGIGELFSESSDCAKSHSGGFWGAVGPLALACVSVLLHYAHTSSGESYLAACRFRTSANDWTVLPTEPNGAL